MLSNPKRLTKQILELGLSIQREQLELIEKCAQNPIAYSDILDRLEPITRFDKEEVFRQIREKFGYREDSLFQNIKTYVLFKLAQIGVYGNPKATTRDCGEIFRDSDFRGVDKNVFFDEIILERQGGKYVWAHYRPSINPYSPQWNKYEHLFQD